MNDKINEIEKTLDTLVKEVESLQDHNKNLIEYLERTDENFFNDFKTFENWETRLSEMRREEQRLRDERNAKQLLEREGYIVVRNENEIDAEKLKRWVTIKEGQK